jgi:hypothetical protein
MIVREGPSCNLNGQSFLCRTVEVLIGPKVRIRKGDAGHSKQMRTEQVRDESPWNIELRK